VIQVTSSIHGQTVPVALASAVRHLKEGGAHAVKLEGGRRVLPQVETIVGAGIPVMGHLGLTPQSVNVLGGVRRYPDQAHSYT
jgi:3-methyl-2-oxobutanoate hydroxymethyltransferase